MSSKNHVKSLSRRQLSGYIQTVSVIVIIDPLNQTRNFSQDCAGKSRKWKNMKSTSQGGLCFSGRCVCSDASTATGEKKECFEFSIFHLYDEQAFVFTGVWTWLLDLFSTFV